MRPSHPEHPKTFLSRGSSRTWHLLIQFTQIGSLALLSAGGCHDNAVDVIMHHVTSSPKLWIHSHTNTGPLLDPGSAHSTTTLLSSLVFWIQPSATSNPHLDRLAQVRTGSTPGSASMHKYQSQIPSWTPDPPTQGLSGSTSGSIPALAGSAPVAGSGFAAASPRLSHVPCNYRDTYLK